MDDAIDPVFFFMVVVVRQLILYKHEDQEATGDAQSKSENVNERIGFLLNEIPPGDDRIVSEHGVLK